MSKRIVIIGNGIAGITCARNIRKKSDDAITVISSETAHFYSRTALMYIFMGHMKYEHTKPYEDWFWDKNRITLVHDHVTAINVDQKMITLKAGEPIAYDKLVIATGSVSNKPDMPGINLQGVQGLYGMPDVELMHHNSINIKKAVIIGGGLIGIEMAEMLLSRNIEVTFLVREDAYWNSVLPPQEAAIVSNHIRAHHVDLRTATEVEEIIDDGHGRVHSVITKNGETIECEFVGITVGVSPNISIVKDAGIETDKGVLVNEFFETSEPDIYAIGDCVQYKNPPQGRRAVEQVWYTGRIHGETLAPTICGKRTPYNPAPWFNSAKFFDIEYQTYGTVNAIEQPNESSFYWQHPDGKICFRVVYNKSDDVVIGLNVLGMRLRHEVCDKWLQQKRKVDDVMANLHKVNFDPEFFDKHHESILDAYNQKSGKQIVNKRKKAFLFF